MIIIGIDPGKNGGVVILNDKNIMVCVKMPENPKEIFDLLRPYGNYNNCICYLEKVAGRAKMGGGAMFTFGKGYGWLEMALICCEIKTITISPQKWQKHFSVGTKAATGSGTQWKQKLKAKAEQLFPKQKIFLWGSDALLIAEYGRTMEK